MEERADPGEGLSRELAFAAEAELRAFAQAFGRHCDGGEVLGLVGTLGAGKTTFTQSLARGLGVAPDVPVTSPTFVLHRRYQGRVVLEHLDAYRLGSAAELDAMGAGEILEGGGVVVIEWAERVTEVLPGHTIWLHFTITGPSGRRIRLAGPPADLLRPRLARFLSDVAEPE